METNNNTITYNMKNLELNEKLTVIFDLILDISWHFGNQCFDGNCCGDLTLIEYMALKKIHEGNDANIHNIGRKLNITKSGISKIIDKLEKKSYLIKKRSPIDGRVCCVKITKKGSDAIYNIAKVYSEYLMDALCNSDHNEVKIEDIAKTLLIFYQALQKKGYIRQIE